MKMTGIVYIYDVPNYRSVYNASISDFQNITNEGNLNSIEGEGKMVLNYPPANDTSFSYISGAGVFDGVYHGGVVGVNVMGPLVARDVDMLCDDDSYQACSYTCDIESLPCITNPEFPAQQLSYHILSIDPSWGASYFKIVAKNDNEFFIQTTRRVN